MKLPRPSRLFVFSARSPELPLVVGRLRTLCRNIYTVYCRLLEAILPCGVPPALQPGEGGGQQTRHLHVLLLVPHQTPAGPAGPPHLWSLWLGSGGRSLLHQSGHIVLCQQTSQGLFTGQSQYRSYIALKTSETMFCDWQSNPLQYNTTQ